MILKDTDISILSLVFGRAQVFCKCLFNERRPRVLKQMTCAGDGSKRGCEDFIAVNGFNFLTLMVYWN